LRREEEKEIERKRTKYLLLSPVVASDIQHRALNDNNKEEVLPPRFPDLSS
jgi:hypothetical protein